MVTWRQFADEAPHIAEIFQRRHTATHNLCLIATTRADGYPRISPMEPRILDGQLVMVGMQATTKFRDLERDPRFCLHTATVDPYVGEGDVKLWAEVRNLDDTDSTRGSPMISSRERVSTSEMRCSIRSTWLTSPVHRPSSSRTTNWSSPSGSPVRVRARCARPNGRLRSPRPQPPRTGPSPRTGRWRLSTPSPAVRPTPSRADGAPSTFGRGGSSRPTRLRDVRAPGSGDREV